MKKENIDKLIYIANNGVKRKFLFIPFYYDLEDQLKAIEALGESRSSKALVFLKRILVSESNDYLSVRDYEMSSYPYPPDDWGEIKDYPYAQGKIRESLRKVRRPEYFTNLAPNAEVEKEQDQRVLKIIENAIMKLERDINEI